MNFNNLTVLGAGVLGSQIAFQAAFHGVKVVSYDISDDALANAKKRYDALANDYKKDLNASDDKIAQAFANLSLSSNLAEAVKNADIIIESVPEVLDLKKKVWTEVGQLAPAHTIFTTNTSTLLPSSFNDACGDKSRFLALHFANRIWVQNIVEVMGTSDTNADIVKATEQFASQMGMVPIVLHKEQAGYIINSLLVPFLHSASHLLAKEIADPKDIDRVWKMATSSPVGPFEIMDTVGLRTVHAIHSAKAQATGDPLSTRFAEIVKTEYLDKGKTGRESRAGFYDYDDKGNVIL